MKKHLLLLFALLLSITISVHLPAQENLPVKVEKPFKVLTSGKKITIQAKQSIKTVIVWTSNGHRIVEQKDINATAYTFEVTINEKYFFARIDMGDGKMYTEKIGLR